MPLVLDPESWTPARLHQQIEQHCTTFDHLAGALRAQREKMVNPFALDTGIALLGHSAETARSLLPLLKGDRWLLSGVLNQMYETLVALPYLIRAATEPMKMPPSPKPPRP